MSPARASRLLAALALIAVAGCQDQPRPSPQAQPEVSPPLFDDAGTGEPPATIIPAPEAALRRLHDYLERHHYEASYRALLQDDVALASLFEQPALAARIDRVGLPDEDRALLRLFLLGQSVPATAIGDDPELMPALAAAGLLVADGDRIRTSGVSLSAHALSNRARLYLLTDQPTGDAAHAPPVQLAISSLLLLARLDHDAAVGVRRTGVAVDFGAGSGIQGLALLLLHPGITDLYALEIDGRALTLAGWNAALNGVVGRFHVIDNHDPKALAAALGDRAIDYAVTNPPTSIVPQQFAGTFGRFGYGGPDGLGVLRIFLHQLAPLAAPRCELIFGSQLAAGVDGSFLVERDLRALFPDHARFTIERGFRPSVDLARGNYAAALAALLERQSGGRLRAADVTATIDHDLAAQGIAQIDLAYVVATRAPDLPAADSVVQAVFPLPLLRD